MIPKMNMVDKSVKKKESSVEADKYKYSLLTMSKLIWVYFGYSGLGNPWHDSPDPLWSFSLKTINRYLEFLDQEDITLESYVIFFFPLVHYSKYGKVGNLISSRSHRSWAKKLRQYCKSAEVFDETADLLLKFFEYQVEYDGKAFVSDKSLVKKDLEITNSGKYCEAYHRLVDRVVQLKSKGIDPEIWLREKVRNIKNAYKDSPLQIRTVVNINGLEPSEAELANYTEDNWRDIRDFLGLSQDCEFVDEIIPKGWGPSGDDRDNLKKVVKIDKDGYYYYGDGVQRRGRFHYCKNSYFVIGCNPTNFETFKHEWLDRRLLSASPTWDEYDNWGIYKGLWGFDGEPLNQRGRKVRWRSNGRKKTK